MISAGLLLAACGSGGGVNSGGSTAPPTATPAPTPAPSPAPSPTSSADSAEYKASGAVVIAKAAYAYDRGITGKGVTIAVLDTGINRATPEFAGRISPDSTGFEQRIARCGTCAAETLAPFPIDDKVGHGTEVASIALAARNGAGPQGLAPEATLLALKIVGADLSGQTAGSTGPIPESSSANAMLIAPAIRYAVEKGAFVSVLSLNGFGTGQLAQDQRAAMDQVRLADRLLVNSIDNATGKDSFTGEFAENLVGTDRANKDWFLFAIGVDQNGNPRSANGNAGPLDDRMLAAGGNNVQVVDKDGKVVSVTGNSFAAPAVAGAAALLKQYWPQLGGKAISRILLDTATDAGAPGVDPVFGAGILNVEKAMQAQAPASSFVAADAVLTRFSSLTTSAPFGGSAAAAALTGQVGGMTVFDRYGRDYGMTGSAGVRARGSGLLASAMVGQTDVSWRAAQAEAARFGFATNVGAYSGMRPAVPAVVSFAPAAGQQVTLGTNVAIGGGNGLAGSALRGIASMPVGSMSAWSGGGWSASFSSGTSRDGRLRQQIIGFAMPLGFGFELSDLAERDQVLGMRSDAILGLAGARTTLATLTYRQTLAGIDIAARATASSTRASGGSDLLRFGGPLIGSAFALEGARGLFGGRATLGLSSPLRVERARAMLLAPVSFDLVSGALVSRTVAVDLAPEARELDLELGWSTVLSPTSSLRVGVAHAFDAGHVAGASNTAGFVTIAIR
ncbi:S8 family serine peptidase [Sphingomonas hankookensis]|uniref:S8 family serine peptidase n=1 Tax=Sphingomonas hankookensis TaxID=563996 RepID=UPI001F5751C0